MNTKYWFAIISLIALLSISSTAMATITVSDMNISCSPTMTQTGACFYNSAYTLKFDVTDSNVIIEQPSADGNILNYKYVIHYGKVGNMTSTATITSDANLEKICADDILGNDNNFNLKRNCTATLKAITNISNGTWYFDVNVIAYSGATFAQVNKVADDNSALGSFTINNALATSQTLVLLPLLAIILAGVLILFGIINFFRGDTGMVTVVSFLAGAALIIVYVLMQSVLINVLSGGA